MFATVFFLSVSFVLASISLGCYLLGRTAQAAEYKELQSQD